MNLDEFLENHELTLKRIKPYSYRCIVKNNLSNEEKSFGFDLYNEAYELKLETGKNPEELIFLSLSQIIKEHYNIL